MDLLLIAQRTHTPSRFVVYLAKPFALLEWHQDVGTRFQKTYYPRVFVSGVEHEDDLVLGGTMARHQKFIGVSYCSDRSYLAGQYDGFFVLLIFVQLYQV